MEDISGCLLGDDDDGSNLSKDGAVEGLPIPKVWSIASDVLELRANQVRRDPLRQLKTRTPDTVQQPIDSTTSDTQRASHVSAFVYPHSRSVKLQEQSICYSSFILGLNSEEFGRVMAVTRETSRFGEGPMAEFAEH